MLFNVIISTLPSPGKDIKSLKKEIVAFSVLEKNGLFLLLYSLSSIHRFLQ